jgi:FtsP/CotA-like multicopper oxidase with cupredoxin domain
MSSALISSKRESAILALALLGTLLTGCTSLDPTPHANPAGKSELPPRLQWIEDGIPMAEPLTEPFEFVSSNGGLEAEVVVGYYDRELPSVYTRDDGSYGLEMTEIEGLRNYGLLVDGEMRLAFPGPTIRLKEGDTHVELTLKNRIDNPDPADTREDGCNDETASPPDDEYPNCWHNDDVVNMHYHGSHVTPSGTGDNIFVSIEPGEEFTNDFYVGPSQMPGTHWYHSHVHGSTAKQNNWGMAMRPGEVKRFRIVSGTSTIGSYIELLTVENPAGEEVTDSARRPGFYQIAQDGVQFLDHQWQSVLKDPAAYTDISLDSGNRADFLVKAPLEAGDYYVVAHGITDPPVGPPGYDLPQVLGAPGAPGLIDDPVFADTAPPLFIIDVNGPRKEMALPRHINTLEQLPAAQQRVIRPIADNELVRRKTVVFDMGIGTDTSPQFYLDGEKYDMEEVDHCMVMGTAEEWKLVNRSTPPHPFHIHVNPFEIVEYYDANDPGDPALKPGDPRRRWQDVIALPPARVNEDGTEVLEASYVTIRSRYLDYTGEFVLHCHILGHEDRGMMQNVQIIEGTREECLTLEESGTMTSKHGEH